jgi:hypothetical protein
VSPLATQLLRRVALFALLAALLLSLGPPLLHELGLLGGGTQGAVDAAIRAIDAARAYGGRDDDPPLAAARSELARAAALMARGEGRRARRAAAAARERAVDAQRLALTRREETRREAQKILVRVDEGINDLEELYGQVVPGLDRATVGRLLGVMKEARSTGAALFLAQQQGDHEKVVAGEAATLEALSSARRRLEAARRPVSQR